MSWNKMWTILVSILYTQKTVLVNWVQLTFFFIFFLMVDIFRVGYFVFAIENDGG